MSKLQINYTKPVTTPIDSVVLKCAFNDKDTVQLTDQGSDSPALRMRMSSGINVIVMNEQDARAFAQAINDFLDQLSGK